MILLLLFTSYSCAPTEKVVYKDVPPDHMVIKKETLDNLMQEMIYLKYLLLDCLERERAKSACWDEYEQRLATGGLTTRDQSMACSPSPSL